MKYIYIVFDPANEPDLVFVEVEDEDGKSFRFGEWVDYKDGLKALKIEDPDDAYNDGVLDGRLEE